MPITVRTAETEDARIIATFINELAAFERLADRSRPELVRLTVQLSNRADRRLYCYIASDGNEDVGFALAYLVYSTFQTCWNMHLEDFYVRETARGTGAGRALFARICRAADLLGCELLDLEVLKWNEDSIALYERWGGARDDEWSRMRFDRSAIERLALEVV